MVAGDGPLAGVVRAKADALRTPIHMLGFLNQSQMPDAYAAADVLVLPSTARETWGLVANEALACGTPIVVSDAVGCAPDLAGDGSVGRTFPVGDVPQLARSVQQVFAQLPDRSAMRSKLNQFGLGASADGIVAAAESCLARRPNAYPGTGQPRSSAASAA
jgi:glycosyltransferase involved in cell wall biosynthesis